MPNSSGIFPLAGFPYGLNTTTDEALLGPKYSPKMLNVFVSESDSIKRRPGFSVVYPGPVYSATAGIDAMYRFYRSGEKYQMLVCGTHLYAGRVVSTEYPEQNKQFLKSNVSQATYGQDISCPYIYTNSNALLVLATCTVIATIRQCTGLYITIPSMTASVKINSAGSYSSITGTSRWTPTVFATTSMNTLYIKPTPTNASSVQLTGYTGLVRTGGVAGRYETGIYFHDDVGTNVADSAYVVVENVYHYLAVGVRNSTSTTKICYSLNGTNWYATSIDRSSSGWFKFAFVWDEKEGVIGIWVKTPSDTTFGTMVAHDHVYAPDDLEDNSFTIYNSTGSTSYFDQYEENYTTVDDFSDLGDWTEWYGTSTIVNSHYNARPKNLVIDEARYMFSSVPAFLEKVTGTVTSRHSFITMNDYCYYGNEYRAMRKYNGSTATRILAATHYTATNTWVYPAAGYMVDNKNRVFMSYDNRVSITGTKVNDPLGYADKTYMIFSVVGDPQNLDVASDAGQFRVVPRGGDAVCTGLAVFNEKVYYFSYSRCAVVNTTGLAKSDWDNQDISTSHGCIAPKSLAVGPKGMVFLSSDGVRAYGPLQQIFANDGTGFAYLSQNVYGINKEIDEDYWSGREYDPERVGYSRSDRENAVGAYYDNKYWLFIGNDCYVADLEKKTDNNQPVWTKYQFTDMDSATTRVNCAMVTRGDEYSLLVGTKDGSVYRMDYDIKDNGNPIHWEFETAQLAIEGYNTIKHIRNIQVGSIFELPYSPVASRSLYSQSFIMDVETEDEDHGSLTKNLVATLTSDINPTRAKTSVRGRALKIRVHGTSDGEAIQIPYMIVNHTKARVR